MVKFRRSIVKFNNDVVKFRVKSSDSGESRQIHSKIVKTILLELERGHKARGYELTRTLTQNRGYYQGVCGGAAQNLNLTIFL
jgi:hypothetical protein